MATDEVFMFPHTETLDGLNLLTKVHRIMFEKKIDDYRLNARENTLLATYPRTGTSWLSQVVSLLLADEDKYEEIQSMRLEKRVPYLEYYDEDDGCSRVEQIHDVPAPRAVKTHLPYRFIRRWIDEDNVKTIITTRNPKDTLVSLYHFYRYRAEFGFSGSWDDFFKHVQAGKVLYGDQYEWLKDWDDNRDRGQLMFIKYEDMKEDLQHQIKRIISFLGLQVSDTRVQKAIQRSNIKQMKRELHEVGGLRQRPFVRSGQTGEWKKHFTVEQNEWFDEKFKKHYEDLNIDVQYE